MPADQTLGFTNILKWKLAVTIVFIYLPIRIYVSNEELNLHIIQNKGPLWFIELLVNICFFRVWIGMIGYIQSFFDWVDQTRGSKLPAQFITFLIGFGLAILFNFLFMLFWFRLVTAYSQQFHVEVYKMEIQRNPPGAGHKRKSNTGLTIMAMLATFYLASNRRINMRMAQVQLNAERLERENLNAQLIVLKNQLSPHFLFNSFSILTSLIESDPEKSVTYVNRLSKSYRYILEQSGSETVRLKKELEFIETYAFLLESRFENKLKILTDIPGAYGEQYLIAPLTLQLLIENAVKHNQMSDENPLVVTIRTEMPYLVVSNPIFLRPSMDNSVGLGLSNIVGRYKLLSAKEAVIEKTDGHFTVKIPLLS